MKKLYAIFLLVLLSLFSIPAKAQIKVGLQAGLNLANLSLDPMPAGYKTGQRARLLFGGVFNYNFSDMLGLQLEPSYTQKGSTFEINATIDGASVVAEGNFSGEFIDIPLLLKATFGNEQIKPFLLAGASAAIRIGDVKQNIEKATVNGQNVTSMLTQDQKEQVLKTKRTDFLLNLGGGILMPMGQIDIFLEGLYNLDLININDEPNDNTEIKTEGFHIKLGALISL